MNREIVMIIGLLLLAGFAAWAGKWDIAGGIATGMFALLNTTGKITVPNSTAG